jgi:hypothetical protein
MTSAVQGTSKAYTLKRLKKDRPDLTGRVDRAKNTHGIAREWLLLRFPAAPVALSLRFLAVARPPNRPASRIFAGSRDFAAPLPRRPRTEALWLRSSDSLRS